MEAYEAPWVGVLMDISEIRKDMEEIALSRQERWYGHNYTDDLLDGSLPAYSRMLEISEHRYSTKPTSWSRALSFICNNTLFSPTPDMLRGNLVDLAALIVAWVEDLDRRDDVAS